MAAFDIARVAARALREAYVGASADGPTAVADASKGRGFTIKPVPPGDAVLGTSDAKLLREWFSIYVRNDVLAAEAAAYAAHELGHLELHQPQEPCSGSDPDAGSSRASSRVESYGPSERRELQANVFAREFLLPRSLARRLFLEEGKSAVAIAEQLRVPEPIVRRQLFDSILGPDVAAPKDDKKGPAPKPDPSQEAASEFSGRALLLEAGPGSGKTRTLVRRVEHLLSNKIPAGEILALTFSNKAAGEIADRIRRANPVAAAELWSGTFHAFGLDLIRRYYDRLNLPSHVQMIDGAQAIELLEDRLPLMGLDHFHDLRYPEQGLKKILAAISRAKDELVDAEAFMRRAVEAEKAASTDEQVDAARRSIEAGRVYEIYDAVLRDAGAVDFGDLVMLPTRLLIDDDEARGQVAARHSRVLVDEYQDVNRASARLLAELYRAGASMWVVGDARQSLYRWRGASSQNMAAFEKDFPGAKRLPLQRNYRSTGPIVSLGRMFAKDMRAGKSGLAYEAEADRDEIGSPTCLAVGLNDACEGELLSDEIIRLRGAGVRYGDQAVVAPTNARLDIMAEALAARDIPTTHLGSFFEREEVRDILAVLALVAEPNGGSLVRLAATREIDVSAEDVAAIVRQAQAERSPLIALLLSATAVDGVSESGGKALERLGARLNGLTPWTSAYEVATSWLVDRSDYLRHLATEAGSSGMAARAAILSLLSFLDQRELGGQPLTSARALKRMRSTILLADDRDLRAAALGSDADAVHMMTIHGAKGLEFPAVHVVGLHDQCLPGKFRKDDSPVPPGLIEPETRETHLEEEECLFFVAITRAEDHLRLYHNEKAAVQARKPSPFLKRLGALDVVRLSEASAPPQAAAAPRTPVETDRINLFDIRDFDRCPRRIAYRRFFGILGRRHESPFLQTSGVLYQLVDQVAGIAGPSLETDFPNLFDDVWASRGPVDHGLADQYRQHAAVQAGIVVSLAKGYSAPGFQSIDLPIRGGIISVEAPLVRSSGGLTEVRFIDAGKARSTSGNDLSAGLLLSAARHAFGARVDISIAHVTGQKIVPVTRPHEKVAADIERAELVLGAIKSGDLPRKRNMMVCQRCPYFIGCPSGAAPSAP